MTNKEINLVRLAFAVGQICGDYDMTCKDVEALVDCANNFTEWEKENVLSLPNGWEDHINNGGDDYESAIYNHAREFADNKLGKKTKQREFIVLQFDYDGETFNERIYVDDIDRNHYDDMWDWWFGAPKESKNPALNFEVLGKKDRYGNIIADKFNLNVYLNEDCDTPIATFPCCYLRISKSWIGLKEGFSFYYE